MSNYKNLVILIAEDDDGHAELIKEALSESGVCNIIQRFANGQQVWDFLNDNVEKKSDNLAFLILLDINMPRMDGIELLKKLKGDMRFKDIPVIMLTTTDDPREVEQCYKLGCNAYVTKPVDFSKFATTLHNLGLFIQIVKV